MNLRKLFSYASFAFFTWLIFLLSCSDTKTYSTIAKISVGKERIISIFAENSWEISRGLFYDVIEAGKVIVPKTLWGTDDGKSKYSFFSVISADGNMVGIIEKSGVGIKLIIIQDFQSKESWPRLNDNEVSNDPKVKKKWGDRFVILKNNNPDLPIPPYFKNI